MPKKKVSVGIIAPSSVVPPVEFALGIEHLKDAGFSVKAHPQCWRSHLFFSGTDEERAEAFYQFATDPKVDVLWCARGGYGAARLLPLLEKLSAAKGAPVEKKLLVGYSDATVLMEFVRTRWGWSSLHAPMPGLREFAALESDTWRAITRFVKGKSVLKPWGKAPLQYLGKKPAKSIQGELVGGNLAVWTSMIGTSYASQVDGKILFLEDVGENLYRVDRMVRQLAESGSLSQVKAVVLGTFHLCDDHVPNVLLEVPQHNRASKGGAGFRPLRPTIPLKKALTEIFRPLSERFKFPVAFGLPVGHGPGHAPLPLGAEYRLSPQGELKLVKWNWLTAES